MKLYFDTETKLLCASETLNEAKEYSQTVGGYSFSSFDKEVIVWHKKQFKIVNIKDLGDKMSVFYRKEDSNIQNNLNTNSFSTGLGLFNAFDEKTGNQYNFLYKYHENKLEELNKYLEQANIDNKIIKNDKWICLDKFIGSEISELEDIASFLFALTLLYGKLDIKNGELRSIKIHIPLFGQYLKYQNEFDSILDALDQQGIFASKSIQETNDGITYQISSSDYELLQSFVNFYKPIENIEQISKYKIVQETTPLLKEFIETLDCENKAEIIDQIDNWTIKILQK